MGRLAALLPAVDVEGPRVRLGMAWAAVSFVAMAIGPVAIAVVMAPVALAAAGQASRSWNTASRAPYRPVAVAGATLVALAGAVDPLTVAGAATVTGAVAFAVARFHPPAAATDPRLTAAIGILTGAGAASMSVARDELGATAALVLLTLVHVVDASAFIVGSGASSRWEGPVAGLASAVAVGLAAAAVLVPPFRGPSPWILALTVAALAPAGEMVATALTGRTEAPVPALRRLDSVLVTGPVWALMAAVLLDLS